LRKKPKEKSNKVSQHFCLLPCGTAALGFGGEKDLRICIVELSIAHHAFITKPEGKRLGPGQSPALWFSRFLVLIDYPPSWLITTGRRGVQGASRFLQ
jgi:hypothetical protein